jgi:hypothetical protein
MTNLINSSSADETAHQRLLSLSKSLLSLHKTLLESERVGYEESFGTIATPAAFFQLVTGDPWFAWLRQLSAFIVSIDERLGEKARPVTRPEADEFIGRARALLTPREEGAGFGLHYHNAMQRDPDVILAHAGLMKFLATLQAP